MNDFTLEVVANVVTGTITFGVAVATLVFTLRIESIRIRQANRRNQGDLR